MSEESYKSLLKRVSVRSYKKDPVPDELIDKILEAGLAAPSGMNFQGTKLVVFKGKKRDELMKLNAKILGRDGDPFYGAPIVIAVLDDPSAPCATYDGSLAAGQMLLAADELGLGACWIHRAKQEFELPEGKALLKEAGIDSPVLGVANIIIGYIGGPRPEVKSRKPGRIYKIG